MAHLASINGAATALPASLYPTSLLGPDVLAQIAPRFADRRKVTTQAAIIIATGVLLPDLLPRADIVTPLRVAHFLAQLAHESDGFSTTVEYASGAAYEGRKDLGNSERGDGVRFKGRGLIQLTGRANYRAFASWMGGFAECPNFAVAPERVAELPWALWAAIHYWQARRLNALAEKDDLAAVTKAVNGGLNGLASRSAYLAKAKAAIARIDAGRAGQPTPKG